MSATHIDRIERSRKEQRLFPGRFKIMKARGKGDSVEVVAGDEMFLFEKIKDSLGDQAGKVFVSLRTGEVRVGQDQELVLIFTHIGPARVRRTA